MDNLEQLKASKEKMLDHLDALKEEEFKLWSLAHNAGAVGTLEPDADVCEALHELDKAIYSLRKELMSYMNDQIETAKLNDRKSNA